MFDDIRIFRDVHMQVKDVKPNKDEEAAVQQLRLRGSEDTQVDDR